MKRGGLRGGAVSNMLKDLLKGWLVEGTETNIKSNWVALAEGGTAKENKGRWQTPLHGNAKERKG